jgi:hypothetical protein
MSKTITCIFVATTQARDSRVTSAQIERRTSGYVLTIGEHSSTHETFDAAECEANRHAVVNSNWARVSERESTRMIARDAAAADVASLSSLMRDAMPRQPR